MRRICKVEGCDRTAEERGYCILHFNRWKKYGAPRKVKRRQTRVLVKGTSYDAVHQQVKRSRGPASDHPCSRCSNPAQDWAYDHLDPDEVTGPDGHGRCKLTYSLDVWHYLPLCKRCHGRFDALHRAELEAASQARILQYQLEYSRSKSWQTVPLTTT